MTFLFKFQLLASFFQITSISGGSGGHFAGFMEALHHLHWWTWLNHPP